MLTCKEISERATDFMERRMSLAGKLGLVAHLAMCRMCRAYMRQMRTTVSVLRELGRERSPAPVPVEVMAMFRAWRPPSEPKPVSRAAAAVHAIERLFGGARAYLGAGLVLLASMALLGLAQPMEGPPLSLGAGFACLGQEIAAGFLPPLAIAALVWRAGTPLSARVYALAAGAGALVGQATLHFSCPAEGWRLHMTAFHVGGVALALAIGAIASLVQPARRRAGDGPRPLADVR